MLNNLLAVDTQTIMMIVIMVVLLVAVIGFYIFGNKKRKQQEKEAQDLINSVKPGNKVKTIGGICGIVVEVDNEENTFVLETGTTTTGKCFIKFDRQAIYQTDAVAAKDADKKADEKSDEKTENAEEKTVAPEEKEEKVETVENTEEKSE